MTRGGGRCPSRAGRIRRQHGVGAKIGVDGGDVDRVVKPAGVGIDYGGRGSIFVREGHARRSLLRIDGEGNLYVLDSEDEGSDTEVTVDGVVAGEGAMNLHQAGSYDLPVEGHLLVDADGAAVKDLRLEGPPLVVQNGAAADDLPRPSLVPTDKAEDMDMAPEVAARLKKVLAKIDPIYHDVFIEMCKVLVPAFFRP